MKHRHLNPERVAERLVAIAHPVRVRMLQSIVENDDRSVSEMAVALRVGQSRISHHVAILERARIIRCRPCGRKRCPQFITPEMKTFFLHLTREIDLTPDR